MSDDDDDVVCLTPLPPSSATGSSVPDGEPATPPSGATKTTQTLVLRPLGSGRVFTATTSPPSEATTESGPVFTATFNQTKEASASSFSSATEGFGRLAAAPATSTNSSSQNGNLSPSKKTSLENGTSSTSSTTTPSHPMLKLTTEEFMKRLNETSQPLAPLQPNHRPSKTYASTVLPLPPPSSFEPSHHHPFSPAYTSYRPPPRPSQPPPVTSHTVYYPHLPPQDDDDNGPRSTPSLSAEDRARREAFLTRKFRNQKLMERYSSEQKVISEALTNAVPGANEVASQVSATPPPAPSTSHVIKGGYQPFLNAANEANNPPDAFEFESLQDVSRARQQQWTDHRQQHELRRMNQALIAKHNKQLQLQRNIVSKVMEKEPSKRHTLVVSCLFLLFCSKFLSFNLFLLPSLLHSYRT